MFYSSSSCAFWDVGHWEGHMTHLAFMLKGLESHQDFRIEVKGNKCVVVVLLIAVVMETWDGRSSPFVLCQFLIWFDVVHLTQFMTSLQNRAWDITDKQTQFSAQHDLFSSWCDTGAFDSRLGFIFTSQCSIHFCERLLIYSNLKKHVFMSVY